MPAKSPAQAADKTVERHLPSTMPVLSTTML
jgi:hypothetical protein